MNDEVKVILFLVLSPLWAYLVFRLAGRAWQKCKEEMCVWSFKKVIQEMKKEKEDEANGR